jgi:hypothetical protein
VVDRGLESLRRYVRRLVEVQLPAFESGQPQAWPPPRKTDPAVFAPMPHNRRSSAEWGVAAEEQARATRERHERELRRQLVRPSVVIGGRAKRLTFAVPR